MLLVWQYRSLDQCRSRQQRELLENIFPIAPSYHALVQHRPPASKQWAFLVELFQKAFLAS
jgi:hypothetical protein